MGTRCATAVLAALLLAGPAGAQDGTKADEPLYALRAAFSEGDDADQIDAIRRGAGFVAPAVLDELLRGLHASSPLVREAAVRALEGNRASNATQFLGSLQSTVPWRFRANEELEVLWIRALGRRGAHVDWARPAITYVNCTRAIGRARIAAAARVRTRDSLTALLDAQRESATSTRPRRKSSGPPFAAELRAALVELSGVDRGATVDGWQAWWKQYGKAIAVPPKRPEVPHEFRARWEAYWGEPWEEGGPAVAATPPGPPTVRCANPTPEEVAEAVAGLKAALLEEDSDLAAAGIEEFGPVDDPAVQGLLVAGLGWPRAVVRNACVRALGWLGTPAALEALHRFHRTSPYVARDEDLHVLVLRSIGRFADATSIPELGDASFRGETLAVGTARILSLARVRRRESIEAILTALTTGGPRTRLAARPGEPRFMEPARLALMILTSQDFGRDAAAWQAWWASAEKGFEVSRDRPELPPEQRRTWEEYWGESYR